VGEARCGEGGGWHAVGAGGNSQAYKVARRVGAMQDSKVWPVPGENGSGDGGGVPRHGMKGV